MRDTLIGVVAGGLAAASVVVAGGAESLVGSADVLAALFAVVWRAEDLFETPEWLQWAVFAGLLAVLIAEVFRWRRQ